MVMLGGFRGLGNGFFFFFLVIVSYHTLWGQYHCN